MEMQIEPSVIAASTVIDRSLATAHPRVCSFVDRIRKAVSPQKQHFTQYTYPQTHRPYNMLNRMTPRAAPRGRKRDQITKLIIVATPALLEGLQLHYAPECIFSFELTLSNAGDLVACTRLSESMALHLTRVTIMPNVMSRRLFVLYTLRETIMERELRAGLAVWPMKFTTKFPFEWLMAIPGLAKWRRSSQKRSVMVRIFEDDADAEETLGFSAWHAPKGKDVFRYAKISVPPPNASVMAPPTTLSRRSSELNFIEYDTETQLLVGYLNITHFIGHKRVGGAPVDPQNKRAKTGEVFKLGAGWVKEGERAPTQAALLRSP